jgi:uncharacterized protein YecE (DUF72 family)
MTEIRIGCSGYYYAHWKNRFYPEGTKSTELFGFYQQSFDTVEINATFYHNPTERQVDSWIEKSKDGFVFCFKAPRTITHYKRFVDCRDQLLLFLHLLKPVKEANKLGVILFQSPPSLLYSEELLRGFLDELPPGYRYAFEFRNREYCNEAVYGLLKERDMDFVWAPDPSQESFERLIASYKYIRMHGTGSRYASNYSEDELRVLAGKIRDLKAAVYCYFNNDYMAYAPRNALRLIQILKEL